MTPLEQIEQDALWDELAYRQNAIAALTPVDRQRTSRPAVRMQPTPAVRRLKRPVGVAR